MTDDTSPSRRPTLAVATVGHHRHGKTTLTAAITRVLSGAEMESPARIVAELDRRSGCLPFDRSPRVVARDADGAPASLTIRGSQIRYDTERRAFVHIDCPGRAPWLKNAVRCQALADALILVVAATESVQPQTREHLIVARALGIRRVVVFLNQCDRVHDLEWLDLVEQDTRELLERHGFDGDGAPVIRGAALPALLGDPAWEVSVHDLIEALTVAVEVPAPASEGEALLHIHQVFTRRPHGGGVIVEGRLRRGALRRGDTLGLCGIRPRIDVRIADLEVFHRKVDGAEAGQFVGLHLTRMEGLRRHEIDVGQALVAGEGRVARRIGVQLDMLAAEEGGRPTPVADGHTSLLLFGAAVMSATLRLPSGRRLHPGESGEAAYELRAPVVVEPGMTFVVRDGSQGPHWKQGAPATWGGTAATGRVVTVEPA